VREWLNIEIDIAVGTGCEIISMARCVGGETLTRSFFSRGEGFLGLYLEVSGGALVWCSQFADYTPLVGFTMPPQIPSLWRQSSHRFTLTITEPALKKSGRRTSEG